MNKEEQANSSRPRVCIDAEHETGNGWLYTLTLDWPDSTVTEHVITLAWVDHEHLVGGAVSPSTLIHAAALIAAKDFGQAKMPARCDIASLRRQIDQFDERVRVG